MAKSIYLTGSFWAGVFERALKTGAQSAVAFLATSQAGLIWWDWPGLGSITGAAVILSILTSLATPAQASAAPIHLVVPAKAPPLPAPAPARAPLTRPRHLRRDKQ